MLAASRPHEVFETADGPEGTRTVLKMMRDLVIGARFNPQIRQTAVSIVQGVTAKDWEAEIDAVFQYVRDNVRYTLDINEVETVRPPEFTLSEQHGDCDDMCVALASLLECVGHRCGFMALGFGAPVEFTHVIVITSPAAGGDWIPLDPTEDNAPGWFPPGVTCSMSIAT